MKKTLGKRHNKKELKIPADPISETEDRPKRVMKRLKISNGSSSSDIDDLKSDSEESESQSMLDDEESLSSKPVPPDNNKPGWHWKFSPEEILRELERDDRDRNAEKLKFNNEIIKKDDITIEQSRGFLHSDKYGWHWHKSWTLPNITVHNQAIETGIKDGKLIVVLKAVKIFHDKGDHVKLQKIDLRGDTTKNFTMNKVCFSKIKFTTTSYKNDGLKFHLVINLIAQDIQQPSKTQILHSLLSPPIFVDSSSQTKKTKRMRKTNGYFSPFDPKYLKKNYTKKELAITTKGIEYKIQNNFVGLYNYLTAINIKHKTKHPLFLTIQFSKCFKLYFNSQILSHTTRREEEIISRLQIIMNNLELVRDYNKARSTLESPEILEKKLFIFYVEIPNDSNVLQSSRLVLDYLEPLKHDLLGYCFNLQSIPSFFVETSPIQLAQTYNAIYPFLFKLKGTQNPLATDSTKSFINQIPLIKTTTNTIQEAKFDSQSDTIEVKDEYNPKTCEPPKAQVIEERSPLLMKTNTNKPLISEVFKQSVFDPNSFSNITISTNLGPNTPLNLSQINQHLGGNLLFPQLGRELDMNQLLRNILFQNTQQPNLVSNVLNPYHSIIPVNISPMSGLGDKTSGLHQMRSLFLQLSLNYVKEKGIPATLPEIMSVIERLLQNYRAQ